MLMMFARKCHIIMASGYFLGEFEGRAVTPLDPDVPTAAASLIERSNPAEWTLFSSNTGN